MTILFVGGGTLGPVTPLIAVARQMKKRNERLELVWAGTHEGPERQIVERERITFIPIPTAKLPRFISLAWLSWPTRYLAARRAARELLDRTKPSLVVGVGGFTQVPIMREAGKRKIPCAIHQLDAVPGLSNKAVAGICASVTTSFEYTHPPFGSRIRTERVPTPCRFSRVSAPDKEAAASRFFLSHDLPVVFVVGGGTGAMSINEAIWRSAEELTKSMQIIHVTGKGKSSRRRPTSEKRYLEKELFDEQDMLFAYAAADVVVCRAGMGTLSDLAELKRAAIVIPIPNSHQEANANALKEGASILEQSTRFDAELKQEIDELLVDPRLRTQLGERMHKLLPTDDGSVLAERWLALVKRS